VAMHDGNPPRPRSTRALAVQVKSARVGGSRSTPRSRRGRGRLGNQQRAGAACRRRVQRAAASDERGTNRRPEGARSSKSNAERVSLTVCRPSSVRDEGLSSRRAMSKVPKADPASSPRRLSYGVASGA
jgi:hypothetical protein